MAAGEQQALGWFACKRDVLDVDVLHFRVCDDLHIWFFEKNIQGADTPDVVYPVPGDVEDILVEDDRLRTLVEREAGRQLHRRHALAAVHVRHQLASGKQRVDKHRTGVVAQVLGLVGPALDEVP